MKILFCKIKHMKYYKGICDNDPIPDIPKKRNIGEQYNFKPVLDKNRKILCRGYFEHRENQINLENIGNCHCSDSISGVLVVWFEYLKETRKLQIVGWYKNATVYRNVKKLPEWHYITADAENCVLLPEHVREKWGDYKENIIFGRNHVKYPNDPQYIETLSKTVSKITDIINSYGENWIDKYPD